MIKLNFRRGGAYASKKAKNYLETIDPKDIQEVTVIRHAAIGDLVATRPFLIELKKYFPNAKITLSVIRSYMYGIPDDLIDAVHIIDKLDLENKKKKTSVFQRIKQIKELPKQDIIFDLTDSSLSFLIMQIAQPKLKVGYPYRWIRRMFYDITILRSDFTFETMSMLHQLNILGANTKHYPLEYKLSDKTCNKNEPYIIYFAGASIEARCWGDNNFIELITLMLNKYPNHKHVVLKGIKEDEGFNEIYELFKDNPSVIHQDALPLDKIYDYLAEASLVIVGDTGLRNMALGVHVPTIGLIFAFGVSPLRYLPQVESHEVVYNLDFTKPSAEKVFDSTVKLMEKVYEEKV